MFVDILWPQGKDWTEIRDPHTPAFKASKQLQVFLVYYLFRHLAFSSNVKHRSTGFIHGDSKVRRGLPIHLSIDEVCYVNEGDVHCKERVDIFSFCLEYLYCSQQDHCPSTNDLRGAALLEGRDIGIYVETPRGGHGGHWADGMSQKRDISQCVLESNLMPSLIRKACSPCRTWMVSMSALCGNASRSQQTLVVPRTAPSWHNSQGGARSGITPLPRP